MEGLIIGRNFAFQNGLGLTKETASTNSLWAYFREGFFFLGGGELIIGILPYNAIQCNAMQYSSAHSIGQSLHLGEINDDRLRSTSQDARSV